MGHKVSVERNRLKFAAGHFATFADELEPIHGHNYMVAVEIEGPLTEESWVVDFSLLKRLTREVCDTLDHKFLLQMGSRVLTIRDDDTHYQIQYRHELPYRLPKPDVAALPIDNTTAERLAEYIAGQLRESLALEAPDGLFQLRVGVEEMPGQSAWFETELSS
ncbi:MAG TPA: 6-carboxytetrahydropterin synthase [Dehalococcoidia bacterium]|nr:6-carboxytetrahydropterin synthase [Dehalococcoidia bacterium]